MTRLRAGAVSETLVLFGATGDLARRMLLPALAALENDRALPADFRIVATAREPLDGAAFADLVGTAVANSGGAARVTPEALARLIARITYIAADLADTAELGRIAEAVEGRRAALFLSLAPGLFERTTAALVEYGLAGDTTRLALEKPLGSDLASSRVVNDAAARAFAEDRIFRIDQVQITVAETVGLEGRGGYFDGAGLLRDMVQNHLLQLLALVAMEPPARLAATSIRDEKLKVLQALRPIDATSLPGHAVFGQYAAGAVAGELASSYADDLGRASRTETFVAIKAHVDNWRWKDVPFYLRSGKRLPVRRSEILIQLREVPHSIFAEHGGRVWPNKIVIRLQPDENVQILMMAKEPGLDREGVQLREVPLDLGTTNPFATAQRRLAYERLLLDLIEGDPTLFVRRDEIEAQWTWIDGIRDAWRTNAMPLQSYAAGSWGPSAGIALIERDGRSWHD